ncbi:MAG: MmgE/PrpD family protein [Hyphomicrobiaceae bacterium]
MSKETPNAARLGAFVAASAARTTPDAVLDAGRLCLADWLAVTIGAGSEDAGRIVRDLVAKTGAPGRATVLFGGTAAATSAALANGTLAHCLDFDDTHVGSNTHTSAPVWAATLAVAEAQDAAESAMLRAFITGFEVSAGLGLGMGQPLTARGWHATGTFGRIGAAAAAAALLTLDQTRAMHALALAATQAGGLTGSFGTMAKPFHAGKAASDGVLAAELASAGLVAAPGVLEPGGGLEQALVQDGGARIQPARFEAWQILANSVKPYAACHLVHPAVDAARGANLPVADIRRVRASVSPLAMQMTGHTDARPGTSLAAKFDLRYCLALALHGRPLSARDFPEPWHLEDAVAATAALVEPLPDPQVGYASARLDVEFNDGRTSTHEIATAKGHPGNPVSWDDMWAKFDGLVSPRLGPETETLFANVRNLARDAKRPALAAIRQTLRALRI